MANELTISEFAKKVGISYHAVKAHVDRGNIPARKGESGKLVIDEQEGLEAFATIDPMKSLAGRGNQAPDSKSKTRPKGQPGKPKDPNSNAQTFAQARAMREAYNAQIAKLTFDEKAGKLLDKNEAKAKVFKAARQVRDALFNIPERVSGELADEHDPEEVYKILDHELRYALKGLEDLKL